MCACVRACVCVCVCACVRACVRECVRVPRRPCLADRSLKSVPRPKCLVTLFVCQQRPSGSSPSLSQRSHSDSVVSLWGGGRVAGQCG